MGTILFFLVLIFIVLWLISKALINYSSSSNAKKYSKALSEIDNFQPTQTFKGEDNIYNLYIDENSRKLLYVNSNYKKLFKFEDILSVELKYDNNVIVSKSLSNTIGGAIVGGTIAGGAGAIIGGLSSKSKVNQSINNIIVEITLKDLQNPIISILCYNKMVYSNLSKSIEAAKAITGALKLIIDQVEKEFQQNQFRMIDIKNNESTVTLSVADEISKLAKLKYDGILTEEEFNSQKEKILNK